MAEKIVVDVGDTIRSTIQAMENVASAALAGNATGASTIKGKRITAQYSFKLKDLGMRKDIQDAAQQKLTEMVFTQQAGTLENAIRTAMQQVVENITGYSSNNVRVLGETIGELRSSSDIENEGFAQYIKSPQGAGEVGLPDPQEALDNLKVALIAAITVDVVVRAKGPQIKLRFDQRKLLKLTPHPDQFEPGNKGPFFSWLSLVTGPDFLSGGTPGYSLVRLGQIRTAMNKQSVAGMTSSKARASLKRVSFFENVMRVSRTAGYAGDYAAVMLSNTTKPGAKLSSAQYFGGDNTPYSPSKTFSGFWDRWWLQRKVEMGEFARLIMSTAIRVLIKG